MNTPFPDHVRTETITAGDDEIAAALRDVSVPVLIASVVHLSGDPSFLRGAIRPREFLPNEFQGAMTHPEQTELRRVAHEAICRFRDAGSPTPAPLPFGLIREIMDWIACEHVGDDYAALFAEEMDLAGEDPRRIVVGLDPRDGTPPALSAIIIGCGQSGLLAGVRLKQAGIPFQILEKNEDVGGTWFENTYPGCRVDVGNHYYCYSFEPNHTFSELYSQQPELHRYFRAVMEKHGLGEHVSWQTEVERAVWDDDSGLWEVTARRADGRRVVTTANLLISATGQLNRPYIPDIPGLEDFEGPVFHSAQWDHSVDLRGKRVAMIGAGASGFQIAPAIVDDVSHLVVFQRTAQWMAPNPGYHAAVAPGTRWAMEHLPGFARWYRFMLLWQSSDKNLEVARVDPSWPDLPRSTNALNAQRRELLEKWITSQVDGDAELLAQVIPDYPPMGKRMLQDDGSWLSCLKRANVDLVRDQIIRVDATGICTESRRFDIDVIVLATGFRANEWLFPMEITGREGRTLNETWAGRPGAYLGISVPEFPNFFLMYGPGTNLAHAGSIIFHSECQMRYIGACIRTLLDYDAISIEPTRDAFEDYVARWQRELESLVWGHPSVEHSWYKASDGKVYVLSPWRLVDYWRMTASVAPGDHQLVRRAARAAPVGTAASSRPGDVGQRAPT